MCIRDSHESMTHRITQFASHIAVQYVLDSLYSSYFAKDLSLIHI